jgi:hypothetical protein
MSRTPSVIIFDVNETLSDMRPMAGRSDSASCQGRTKGKLT